VKDVRSEDIFLVFLFFVCRPMVSGFVRNPPARPSGRGISHRSRDGSHVALSDEGVWWWKFVSDWYALGTKMLVVVHRRRVVAVVGTVRQVMSSSELHLRVVTLFGEGK
jgi:hypothetical protein